MPEINVTFEADDLLDILRQIEGAIAGALAAAGKRLGEEGTAYWRSIVTNRTGRMAGALNVVVSQSGNALTVRYVVTRAGFYYSFQRDRERWDAMLVAFLQSRAGQVVGEELQARIP